jgi:hypothetical protein
MRKVPLIFLVFGLTLILSGLAIAGNGAPSGAHYNWNIIGVQNPKSPNMTGSDGAQIDSGCFRK